MVSLAWQGLGACEALAGRGRIGSESSDLASCYLACTINLYSRSIVPTQCATIFMARSEPVDGRGRRSSYLSVSPSSYRLAPLVVFAFKLEACSSKADTLLVPTFGEFSFETHYEFSFSGAPQQEISQWWLF